MQKKIKLTVIDHEDTKTAGTVIDKLAKMYQSDQYSIVLVTLCHETIHDLLKFKHRVRYHALQFYMKKRIPRSCLLIMYKKLKTGFQQYRLFLDHEYEECVQRNLAGLPHSLHDTKCVTCLKDVKWGYGDRYPEPCTKCFIDTYFLPKYNESLQLKVCQMLEWQNLCQISVPAAIQYTIDLYDKHHNYENVTKRQEMLPNYSKYFTKF